MWRFTLGLVLVLLSSYWAIQPFFGPGFFPMHDDTQVGRVVVMGNALRNGQFPVRWVSDLGYGYGYPIFNFYGPLPYYIGGAAYALGLSGLVATKVMFVLGTVLAAVAMYICMVDFLGVMGAVVAGIFYLYAPYHAVQIYVRGAVGEFWILIFLPMIFWGIVKSFYAPMHKKAILIGGIGLGGAIVSHTLLGYAIVVLLGLSLGVAWGFRVIRKKNDTSLLLTHILMVLVGLGLASFFWLPAFFEMGFTNVISQIGATARYTDHFVCLSQLWNSPWGFGGSAPGCTDGLSFKLGKFHVVLAGVAVLLWFIRKDLRKSVFLWVGFSIVIISIFLMLQFSSVVWRIIPDFAFIQYPWRFLALAIFGLSLLTGSLLVITQNRFLRVAIAFALSIGAVLMNAKLFKPQYLYMRDPSAFETRTELRWNISKISDEYLPPDIKRPTKLSEVPGEALPATETLSVGTEINRETYQKFLLENSINQTITIQRAYFPGWTYWVNGVVVKPVLTRGLPMLPIPAGGSVVEMRFLNTPVRLIADIISVITVLVLLYIYGKKTYT